ncbi:hypothetical protein ACFV4G_40870 [Kitasatospora sp. NPDC059747]|uniref:hypothetical protein n=1 Tax=Kitasatospora sp. NPDC059747 TaxID=3346930 RepID=UPI00364C94E9
MPKFWCRKQPQVSEGIDITSTHDIDLHPVLVTAITEHHAARDILTNPSLHIVRANQVRDGDLIVSGFQPATPGRLHATDYFASGPYPASPGPYDPKCGCGVCGLPEVQGPHGTVVLTRDYPWETCDPWPADELLLVLPRESRPHSTLPAHTRTG